MWIEEKTSWVIVRPTASGDPEDRSRNPMLMYRARLSFAFAALVALVCIQAAFVYWGANRVNDYAQHSRLASDIQSELLDLSANKQRLRV